MSRIAYETSAFREDFRRASRQAQAKTEAFIRKFGQESSRGGMQIKSPGRAQDARVKVARVDQGLRAVLLDLGRGDFALLRVMEHDAAYRYAASLRPDVSAYNGLPRLFTDIPVVEAKPPSLRDVSPVDVFAHRTDEEMVTVGVPKFGVRMLRGVPDRHAAAHLADWLGQTDPLVGFAIHHLLDGSPVDDILRELLALEGATEPDAPRSDGVWNGALESEPAAPGYDTTDLAAALDREGAKERFRLVEDSEELVQALQGEFAAWQVFLHPQQRTAAYADSFSGPARVSGGAGTGKTVVLVHRVKALLDRATEPEPPRILVTTFTPHLRRDLARLLGQLIGPERARAVDIRTVDGLARDLHRDMTGSEVAELSSEQELALWDQIAASGGFDRSPAFLRNEYRHILLARGVRSLDDYLAVSRVGRGSRLSADQRRGLWPAFEAFEAQTRQAGRYSTLQLTESVAALLEQLPVGLFDHVLVDEAQDLHASQWRLLRAVIDEGPDDLFIVGDAFQRIYGDTVSLRSLGIETRGRSLRLRRNYRTTHEIVGWALGVLGAAAVVDVDDLGADLRGYHSVRCGPLPRFEAFPDRDAEIAGVVATVQAWIAAGYAPGLIAVVARTKRELPAIVTALQRAGVPAAQLGRGGPVDGNVNVATMHRVKGLEYPCVAVTGLSRETMPPQGAICPPEEDRSQHLTDLQTERSLVYVAATRARDELVITWNGEPASLIARDGSDLALAPSTTNGIHHE